MADPNKNNTRATTFWRSNPPLMSERVRRIVSDPASAERLADAIRAARRGDEKAATFRLDQQNRIIIPEDTDA